ncbi:MAG: tetratricopeptide repeat protein, partial [Planctomycetes bacterium]|nr:tetratricopeptide repeat protein [Planctomycetota bacterium]
DGSDGGFRYRSARRLEDNLATIASAPGTLRGGWQKIQPLSVRLGAKDDEAEALCRVTIGGTKCKFRLWLIRDGTSWKTYDMENLDGSYRLSVIGLQYTPGVHEDEERYSLRDGVMTLQRGAVALAKGQPEAARDAMAMARRSEPPEYVGAWIDLVDGQALSALGDPEGGLKAAGRVLTRHKDLAVAHRLKTTCLAALGDPAKAILAATDYFKLVGDDAEIWTLVGGEYEKLDKPEQAIEAYRKGADADAEDWSSRMELGRLLLGRRETAEAASFFSAAARLAPASEELFENAADLLDQAGAHAEALAISDEAALRRPDEAPVLSRRGRALRKLDRLKEAEETLRHAAKLHPDEPDVQQELLLTLAQAGRDSEAQERMRSAAQGDSWHPAYLRAFVHAAAGRSAAAIEELKPVLRAEWNLRITLPWIEKEKVFEKLRGEKDAGPLLAAARATRDYWTSRENPKLAHEELLRIALERTRAVPDHAVAYADQARALRRLGRAAEAEPAIRTAIEKSKSPTLYRDELGRILAAEGKLDEALAVADELIRAQPKAEEFGLDLRVAAYAIAGKREAAIKALQELLDRHPAWHVAVTTGDDLDGFRKLPGVQSLIKKARAKIRK